MEQSYDTHELNGYKFSFNRVNPYLLDSQNKNNSLNPDSEISSTSILNKKDPISSRLENQVANSNTKQLFYKKIPDNEKHKILLELCLRKTKFNLLKPAYSKDSVSDLNKKHQEKTESNLDPLNLVQQTSEHPFKKKFKPLDELIIGRNSIGSIGNNNVKDFKILPKKINKKAYAFLNNQIDSPKNKVSRSSNFIIVKNYSENKFIPYLQSPKSKSKTKSGSFSNAQTQKFSKPNSLLQIKKIALNQNSNHSSHRKSKKNSQQLYIKIEQPQFQHVLSLSMQEPLQLEMIKKTSQHIKQKIGYIKYKSPRVMLSSRNQIFKSKKPPKIKLFTEQQQKCIIKQFYSQEKDKSI